MVKENPASRATKLGEEETWRKIVPW